RVEQRLLERRGGANIRLRGAAANRDADAHARDVGRRSGRELCARGGVGPHILGHHTKIEWDTARGHLDQLRRGAITNNDLMAGGTLEQHRKLVQRGSDAAPRYDLKFSGSHDARRGQTRADPSRTVIDHLPTRSPCWRYAAPRRLLTRVRAQLSALLVVPARHKRARAGHNSIRATRDRPSKARGRNNKFRACGANFSQALRRRAMARRAATLIATVTTGSAVCPG